MFEKCDSSNRLLKRKVVPFSKFTAKFGLVFVVTLGNVFLRVFIFKPTERA